MLFLEIESNSASISTITFGNDFVCESDQWVKQYCKGNKVGVIFAAGLPKKWSDGIIAQIVKAGKNLSEYRYDDAESNKNIDQAQKIWNWLAQNQFTRHDTIIAIGGGVTTDICGFVASTFHRGMNVVSIPTTLLAQVDASVGGKTGVNLPSGKNLVGTFNQPRAVLIDSSFLMTLSQRQLKCGLAEIIKAAIISNRDLFDQIHQYSAQEIYEPSILPKMVHEACKIKVDVVREDLQEKGYRKVLNLGHTVAHALEASVQYQGLEHGEAVALGLLCEARLSNFYGLLSDKDCKQIESILLHHGLLTKFKTAASIDQIYQYMFADKKNKDSDILFVLPKSIGQCQIDCVVDSELVKKAIASIL